MKKNTWLVVLGVLVVGFLLLTRMGFNFKKPAESTKDLGRRAVQSITSGGVWGNSRYTRV